MGKTEYLKKIITIVLLAALMCMGRTAAAGAEPDNTVPSDYTVNLATQSEAGNALYNRFFLKDDIQEIRITVSEENLKYLFENAADKVSVLAEKVNIGDETVMYAGLKTKGDYTLAHGVSDNHSKRYSFTINFGKYVKKSGFGYKQNFFGLRKLSLNNFFFDKSMLKEYTAHYLLSQMGLPVSQYGLAKLYVNDSYYGVYFMVEAFDYPILEQYYGVSKSKLGKFLTKPVGTDLEYNDIIRDPGLLWAHDDETREDVEEDVPMVIESIRRLSNLNGGLDFDGNAIDVNSAEYIALLSQVIDLDEVLGYFAVHSFLVQNDDMFSVQHNYGLYCDPQGRLVVIPWDYDLSYGTYYPSTADNTANYDIDIMYCMYESWQDYNNREYSEEVYSSFPLFNVIYQNSELMERYHEYMLDCAKIMALGGTTSDMRYYEPANMYNIIEGLSDKLIAAASLKNAPGASYMNRINQPADVKKAIPNLEKIIARRAVGVYSQLSGEGSWVTGSGCDLSAIGNGMNAKGKKSGLLTAVDETTGIFTTASYKDSTPEIKTETAAPGTEAAEKIVTPYADQIENDINALVQAAYLELYGRDYVKSANEDSEYAVTSTVYMIKDKGTPVSGYRMAIPLNYFGYDSENVETVLAAYTVDENDNLNRLEYTADGNLIFFDTETMGTFILAQKKIPKPGEDDPKHVPGNDSEDTPGNVSEDAPKNDSADVPAIGIKDTLFVSGIAAAVILLFGVVWSLIGRIRKKKDSHKQDNIT